MRGQTIAQACAAVLFCFGLAACGGSGTQFSIGNPSSSGSGTTSSSSSSSSSSSGASSSSGSSSGASSSGSSSGSTGVYQIGSLSGSTFTQGAVAIGQTPLSARGSSTLSVSVVDPTNSDALYTASSVQVAFSSPCIIAGTATVTTPVTTLTGTATTTYTASGCVGTDVITAAASIAGFSGTLTATGTITVQAASLGSIQTVSVTPNTIGFKGSGLPQESVIVFKVLDSSSNPIVNQTVTFKLSNTNGGIFLDSNSGTTASDGTVDATVGAGTVPTATSVVATTTGKDANGNPQTLTDTASLAVGTGIPANDNFSFSVTCPNVEALNVDGVKNTLNIYASDRFGAAVLDGTSVSFTSDGGQLSNNATNHSPSCSTVNGQCNITWTSADPRPANGRAVILASAVGEESYKDLNGNGFYDCTGINLSAAEMSALVGQGYTFGNCPGGEPFKDLPEAYEDDNENKVHDVIEPFIDFNQNGKYDLGDGEFTGPLCNADSVTNACTGSQLNVFRNLVIVMSDSTPSPALFAISLNPAGDGSIGSPSKTNPGGTITVNAGDTAALGFTIADKNGNPMASGTTVAFSTVGTFGSLLGTTSFVVPCTADKGGTTYFVTLAASATAASGSLDVKVTSAGGIITETLVPVTIQ